MATVHTEKLALFDLPPYNTSEDKVYYEDYPPQFFNKETFSAITFSIPPEPIDYIDLSQTELYVKLRVEKEDGSVMDKDTQESVLPIDMILNSMWASVEIYLNGKLISSSGTDYAYKSAIETYLSYNYGAKRYLLNSIGYSGEDGRNPSGTHPYRDLPINDGLRTRATWFDSTNSLGQFEELFDKSVEFIGPLHADICNQDRLILNQVGIELKLTPNKNSFRLICNNCTGKLIIDNIFLRVCKVAVSPEVRLGHTAALEKANARYPYPKVDMRTFTINKGNSTANFHNMFEGYIPSKVVVGIVDQRSYMGEFSSNPLNFQHFNIESIGLEVGNESIPAVPFSFNFEENKYLEGLLSLYRCGDKLWQNTDLGITHQMYKNGCTLIAFDMDPASSSDYTYLSVPKKGNLKLNINFLSGLENTVTLIVYAIFPARLEIDRTRLCTNIEVQQMIEDIQAQNIRLITAAGT